MRSNIKSYLLETIFTLGLEKVTYEDIDRLREQQGADQDQLDILERHLDNEAFGGKGWIP